MQTYHMLPRTSTLPSASESGGSQMYSSTVKCLFRLTQCYHSYVLIANRVAVVIIIIIIINNSSSSSSGGVLNSALDLGTAIFI